ncbi:glutathione S-transferase [Fragilaria crotonensis]|nr:glutathione S-transferase [Fragilaria crotonensis]
MPVLLLLAPALSFSPHLHTGKQRSTASALKMGLLDNLQVFKQTPKVSAPKDFVPPEPQPLTLTESADLGQALKAGVALVVRLATESSSSGGRLIDAPRPKKPLILYEYPASPFCKRVRETINLLDLTVEYRPCPGARAGFADELFDRSGRRTVPYLVDPNTGVEMFESGDQIEYLLETYGPPAESFDRKALWPITFEGFSIGTSVAAAVLQDMPGARRQEDARPDNTKMIPLELWGYECSPFVAPVREKLSTLCLPHVFVSCSRGSENRNKMIEKTGRFQVPFLVDPNTGIEMFEGAEIVKYLDQVYTV